MLKDDIEQRFTYHPPQSDQIKAAFVALREDAKSYAHLVNRLCPESREKSLAVTKLEEVVMWANASIARHGLGEASVGTMAAKE
jgi:hypothetical protein